jgi:hypothetical protein
MLSSNLSTTRTPDFKNLVGSNDTAHESVLRSHELVCFVAAAIEAAWRKSSVYAVRGAELLRIVTHECNALLE